MHGTRDDKQGYSILVRQLQTICRPLSTRRASDTKRLTLVSVSVPLAREKHTREEAIVSKEHER